MNPTRNNLNALLRFLMSEATQLQLQEEVQLQEDRYRGGQACRFALNNSFKQHLACCDGDAVETPRKTIP